MQDESLDCSFYSWIALLAIFLAFIALLFAQEASFVSRKC
jgi:hypothetical protein